MALSLEHVKEKFAGYSGEDLSDTGSRGALCAQLCGECLDRAEALLEGREEPGERQTAALESWAAAEAFYQLSLIDDAAVPESFSADGVRIDRGERSAKARALEEEKRREAFGTLGEGGFYFGRA